MSSRGLPSTTRMSAMAPSRMQPSFPVWPNNSALTAQAERSTSIGGSTRARKVNSVLCRTCRLPSRSVPKSHPHPCPLHDFEGRKRGIAEPFQLFHAGRRKPELFALFQQANHDRHCGHSECALLSDKVGRRLIDQCGMLDRSHAQCRSPAHGFFWMTVSGNVMNRRDQPPRPRRESPRRNTGSGRSDRWVTQPLLTP